MIASLNSSAVRLIEPQNFPTERMIPGSSFGENNTSASTTTTIASVVPMPKNPPPTPSKIAGLVGREKSVLRGLSLAPVALTRSGRAALPQA